MPQELNVVVLDSTPLNPGDLDWAPLRELGQLALYEDTAPDAVPQRVAEADVVYTNKVALNAAAFAAAPRLRLVSVLATGYDIIDIDAARRHGVTVCNVPAYGTNSVAQTTIALLLELTHHAGAHDAAVREGQWGEVDRFSFWNYPLVELDGKTLLIVGMGAIGTKVAQIASAMGMTVVAGGVPGRSGHGGRHRVPLHEALSAADVVSLHCPLTPETKDLINEQSLALMKASALLVNTARGGLVDETALVAALQAGRIAGYAADVLSVEPPPPDHPLLAAPRCILTPHLSWASFESRQRLLDASVANLRAFLAGRPQHVVS